MAKLKVEVQIEDAYDMEEAAAILMVGIATIWRWKASGKLATFKVAGRILIPASEIRRIETLKEERLPS